MDDLISRQAVIEINRSYHGQMPNEVNHRIWKEINELPSAQADSKELSGTHKALDTVSRQAVIEAINKIFPADPMRDDYTQGITCGAALANIYVAQLPSAQPETHEERTETHACDLIDRQAAIDALDEIRHVLDTKEKQLTILPSAQQRWIPCSERLPEEDHWLGGSGKQFSDNVLISIVNRDDEDAWVQVSQTIDGTWALELPRYCKVIAWMPLPEPYREGAQE